jgi:serine/threonine-protein kinase
MTSSVLYWEKWDRSEERAAQARHEAERALELSPELPQAHIAMGTYRYRIQRDYDRALEHFQAARTSLPNDPEVLRYISAVLRRQGRYGEAVSNLEKAARLDPRAAYVPTDLGFTFMTMRQYAEADRAYARSLELAPDQEWTYGLRAANHMLSGDLGEARAVLEAIPTTDDPGSVFQWMMLELCERNYEEALNWISRVPQEFTSMREHRSWRGLWKGLIHQLDSEPDKARAAYEEALPLLERAAREEPRLPFVHANLGWAYAALGKREDALREGRLAVELLPISKDAYAGPLYVEMLAQIAVLVGDRSLALDQIETVLSVPADFSAALLEIDPRWDPLRNDPRFQALLD